MKRAVALAALLLAAAPAYAGDWDIVRPPGDGWVRVGSRCDQAPVNPEPLACPKPGPSKRLDYWVRAAGQRGQINYVEMTSTWEGWKERVKPLTYAINCDLWESKALRKGAFEGDKDWQSIRPGTMADDGAKIACGL